MKNGREDAAKVIWCHDVWWSLVRHSLICLVSRTSCPFRQTREWALCFNRVLPRGWSQFSVFKLIILPISPQILCAKWLGRLSRRTTSRASAKGSTILWTSIPKLSTWLPRQPNILQVLFQLPRPDFVGINWPCACSARKPRSLLCNSKRLV